MTWVSERCSCSMSAKDSSSDSGETPLYFAARDGQLSVVQLLLERRAQPDKAVASGMAPLHVAAGRGHIEVVNGLQQGGCLPGVGWVWLVGCGWVKLVGYGWLI